MKAKKDRIFVITMGLVLTNLVYWFSYYLSRMMISWASAFYWALLLADITAIIGVLWLLRTYKKGRKIEKEKEEINKED